MVTQERKMIELAIKASPTSAKFIVLKPAGYPMKSDFEHPEINEPRVFDYYAKEQWFGASVKKGDYLFDRRMYPDFAFEIMNVEPKHATIGKSTVIVVQEMENTIPVSYTHLRAHETGRN